MSDYYLLITNSACLLTMYNYLMEIIPQFLHPFLWDTNVSSLSLTKHYTYIIERILEYGDQKAIEWMNSNFTKDQITTTLSTSKKISPKTGALMSIMYNIPRENLQCFRKPFTQKQNRF